MNHARGCDCFECLPGVPATAKPVKATRPERRRAFKLGNGLIRRDLKRWREQQGQNA